MAFASRITGRVALLIMGVSAIIVLLLGWTVFVGPQRSKASDLDTQISSTQTQIVDGNKLLAGPLRKESLSAVRLLEGVVPAETRMSGLIRQLSSISATSAVEFDAITPTAPTTVPGAEPIPMTIALTGHYFAIQHFLQLLRASADLRNGHVVGKGRLYSVNSIQFTGGQPGGTVMATLNINAYIYTAVPAGTTPTTSATSTTATAAGP